jgi:hypothetical protein
MVNCRPLYQYDFISELHVIQCVFVVSHYISILEKRVRIMVFIYLILFLSAPLHFTLTHLFSLSADVSSSGSICFFLTLLLFFTYRWLILFQLHFLWQKLFDTRLATIYLALFGFSDENSCQFSSHLLPSFIKNVFFHLVRIV